MSEDVTLRYELKLICEAQWLAQARSWIRLHRAGLIVAYPPRRVNSLYLDTLDLSTLRTNLDGLYTRSKVRWRWYGEDVVNVQAHLELKSKRNLLSTKKRYHLPCLLDMTQPWSEILSAIRAQVSPEWQVILSTVNQPALLVHYQREYYVTPDGAVRVTLDFDQAAYDQRFSLRPNLYAHLPIADTVVIEVKADRVQVERVQDIVSDFPLSRNRNSKYVSGVLAALYSQ